MQITKFFKLRFNSTLVQLKVVHISQARIGHTSFNSTLVQLKERAESGKRLTMYCFNSTLVQLKGHNVLLF